MEKTRFISVPKNQKALVLLDFDEALSEDLIEVRLSEEEFEHLLNTNFIDIINETTQSDIDDFEDFAITDLSKIDLCIQNLALLKLKFPNSELLNRILYLLKEARVRKTGIFFFF